MRRSLAIVLALFIVVLNNRLSFGKMTCFHTGEVEFTLGAAKQCEEFKSEGHDVVSEPCCSIFNLDIAPQQSLVSKFNPVFKAFEISLLFASYPTSFNHLQKFLSCCSIIKHPPAGFKAGTTTQSFLSVYRI